MCKLRDSFSEFAVLFKRMIFSFASFSLCRWTRIASMGLLAGSVLMALPSQAENAANHRKHAVTQRKAVAPKLAAKSRKGVQAPKLAAVAERPSFGKLAGLHSAMDPLDLRSSVALVIDQDTHEVLLRKNDQAVLPIASLTKLMTGLVISDANLPMSEMITITQDDVDTEKGSRSRLAVGTVLSRGDLLHLALMSSENRAAHALGRTFPGGLDTFVGRMNARAQGLGMSDTRYIEPTGLSSRNQSSAHDLATLVAAAYKEPVLRELSTSPGREIEVGHRTLQYNNTNRLVKSPQWDIGLQKTGYISEAGQCLVMQTQIAGRKLIMVFLDSAGKLSRIADAERVRHWIEKAPRSAAGQSVAISRQG
jgi:serine-type D-Ala-D-Ala endopeptidase (penicillin-binding protein 7)